MMKDKMECVKTCQKMVMKQLVQEGGPTDSHALCAYLGACRLPFWDESVWSGLPPCFSILPLSH